MLNPATLTPDQLEALKVLGGCDHQPNPFLGCDTCGRPPQPGNYQAVNAFDFGGVTVDGQLILKQEVGSIVNMPLDRVTTLLIATDFKPMPHIALRVDPLKGERAFLFHRTAIRSKVGMGADKGGNALRFPVLEIRMDGEPGSGDGRFVRLYMHPRQPVLSTQDLYF